jgi:hypothetical protein
MLRAGAFLPVPPSLQGRAVRFEYESPVKRIREQAQAVAAGVWVQQHISAAVETQRPDILDAVNFEEFSAFTAQAMEVPHRLVNGPDRIAEIRAERQQAQEGAQMEADMHSGAEMAEKLAGAANKAGLTQQPQQGAAAPARQPAQQGAR